MSNHLDRLSGLYGKDYLISKLEEEPFFVENNLISARPSTPPYYWQFSLNPITCEVYDENLERISIFMLHVFNYFNKDIREDDIKQCSLFPPAHSKLLEKVIAELDKSTKFDVLISAYNVLYLIYNTLECFRTYVILQQDFEKFSMVLEKLDKLRKKLHGFSIANSNQRILQLLQAIIVNIHAELTNSIDLIKHRDLKNDTLILAERKYLYFNSRDINLHIVNDNFYYHMNCEISIDDNFDKVNMEYNDISYFPVPMKSRDFTDYPQKYHISVLYSVCEVNSLNCKDNVDDLLRISHLRRTASDVHDFNKILFNFYNSFSYRKKRRNNNHEYILLEDNEAIFIFEFITELILTLNEFLERDVTDILRVIPRILKSITEVINLVRYTEILRVISQELAYDALASLVILLKNKKLDPIRSHTSINLLLILTKVHTLVVRDDGDFSRCFVKCFVSEINLLPNNYIKCTKDIPTKRRRLWKAMLVKGWTAEQYLERLNQSCHSCSEKLLVLSSLCLLICGHAFCCSCIKKTTKYRKYPLCPICLNPIREILKGQFIENVCKELENFI